MLGGTIGALVNSGTIAGDLGNNTSNALTISGGSGTTVGTLTGYTVTNQGTLVSSADVVFAGGNLLLNDSISASGHTVLNTGANLVLSSIVSITGAYTQGASGTLSLSAGTGELVVSGAATIAGTVSAGLSATGNYIIGGAGGTLVAGGSGSDYTNAVAGNALAGLVGGLATSGDNLLLTIVNDYIGGTLASVGNTAGLSVGSAQYGLYVASTGSLGTFANSDTVAGTLGGAAVLVAGTLGRLDNSGLITSPTALTIVSGGSIGTLSNSGIIAGNIINAGAAGLTIGGGTGGAIGTLTGFGGQGTIINTTGNLVFSGGALALRDNINVGTNTVINSGTLTLDSTISIAGHYSLVGSAATLFGGNFAQAGGTLNIVAGSGQLFVPGAVSIASGRVNVTLNSQANYLVGDQLTLVQSESSSINFSAPVNWVGAHDTMAQGAAFATTVLGWASSLSGSGEYFAYVAYNANDYIGGSIASVSNSGSIGFNTAVYVATTGTLGTLTNTGTLGASIGILNHGTIGSIQNDGIIHSATTAIQGDGSYGTLSNSGTIFSSIIGLSLGSHMDALVNSGLFSIGPDGFQVVNVSGTLGTLVNSGRLAVSTISQQAVYIASTGSLGMLVNSGTILGDLTNDSANALVIQGGGGTAVGTFTGVGGGIGTLTNTLANVTLASGSLVLNDRVNVTGHTLVNSGASVALGTIMTVSGDYSQTDGGLTVTPGAGRLLVTGAATLSGGSVVARLSDTGNYLAGSVVATLVTGDASSNYTGVQAQAGGLSLSLQTGTLSGGGSISLLATAISDYVGGTLATLSNSGSLGSGTPIYVATSGRVGTLINAGTLTGGNPLDNEGVIDTLINAGPGTIAGNFLGLVNNGSIGALNNVGLISSTSLPALTNYGSIGNLNNTGTILHGVSNSGTITFLTNNVLIEGGISDGGSIGTLDNSGTITGGGGVQVNGTLALLNNSGQLSGGSTALSIGSGGTLGTLFNTGTVLGNIVNAGNRPLTIIGGTNTGLSGLLTGATLTNVGTITSTGANLVFAGGYLSLNDWIDVGSQTVVNSGAGLTLGTHINITGNYSQTGGGLVLTQGTGLLSVSGAASISGGDVVVLLDGNGNYLANTVIGTAVQGGLGSDYTGATVSATIGNLILSGTTATIGGNVDLLVSPLSDYVGGTLATLNNGGTISGVTIPVMVASSGSVGTLTNSALLSGRLYGVLNQGTIGQFDNSGTATGSIGLYNLGSIGTVLNTGALLDAPAPLAGGVNNGGTIAALINQGVISGTPYGIVNTRTIGTLANSGTISGRTALLNRATGTLGTVSNSGLIAGNILNQATQDLVFTGGSGGTIGTLTGATLTNLGTITNTVGNVVFAAGDLALNDIVTVTGHTLVNSGASLTLATVIGVTGAYSQTAGTLVVGDGAQLAVSGTVGISGGTVLASLSGTGIYLAGNGATLVTGTTGSSYAGSTVMAAGPSGFSSAGTVSGTSLVLAYASDYVGAGLGTLVQTATISGVTHALHVAAGGSIGTVLNSGTLSGSAAALYIAGTVGLVANTGLIGGDIVNAGGDLTITGGGFGTLGTLTGLSGQGVITNTAGDLVFASGNLVLNDRIDASGHTVLNSGASLTLPASVSITGAYRQTGGTLAVDAGTSPLTVSGGASIVGGSVLGSLDAGGNYLVGASYTLVRGGAGSSYAGATIASNVGGLAVSGVTAGQSLLMSVANDYVGGTLATLSNTGTLSVQAGVYVAGTGSVGTLSNDGTLNGTWGVQNLGTLGTLLNSNLINVAGSGIINYGVVTRLVNSGTLLADGTNGISNGGSIGTLVNSGRLVNSQISAGSGTPAAVANGGTIGVLSNSGLISGPVALYNGGSIGLLANSGTIAGDIQNDSANDLTIAGGTSGTVGTLTGYAGVGTLTSSGANVVLSGGSLLLNDQVDVGSGTLVNNGASLRLDTLISVSGTYSQAGGTLALTYGTGQLAVSGAAVLTGGTVMASGIAGTANVLAGAGSVAVSGGVGSTFTGLTYASTVTGLELTGSVGGDSLSLVGLNDYIGGAQGTLANSGTLSAGNAVYVAATGSIGTLSNSGVLQGTIAAVRNLGTIGTLANSGTIIGDIVNLSARDLVMVGGDTVSGTLRGGSIANTASNLVFAGGQLALGDGIDVGGHTVVNSGATLRLDTLISITGAYTQNAGTLALGTLGELAVSGAASIGGGLVQVSLSSTGNYLVNSLTTVVAGGVGSSYTGATITAAGAVAGLGLATTIMGGNLVMAIANDYIGGTLATLTNSGLLAASTAVYVAAGGSLG
ncbi:hypothetical protein, partial [Azospirillum sp. B4]|uniref:hypothetical protein n=1 Tax=Azospirillum sp. B4 TaxID=95605 RepID=UPI0005C99995